jgi:DNA-binding beta-propeller fold protein YncE
MIRISLIVALALTSVVSIAQAGPVGTLYVTNDFTGDILQYDGITGALIGTFVSSGSGGLSYAKGLTFGPNGNLFVASSNSNEVLEYNGSTGRSSRPS